mmetsp:Transcript_11404/g.37447  ORF Transcript_11404/g.37447 Transcript_11404/m.37447 type:complete len:107 (+) Transcript_11404:469-789(+)
MIEAPPGLANLEIHLLRRLHLRALPWQPSILDQHCHDEVGDYQLPTREPSVRRPMPVRIELPPGGAPACSSVSGSSVSCASPSSSSSSSRCCSAPLSPTMVSMAAL